MDNLLRNLLVAGNIVHASFDEMKSIFVNKPTQEGLRALNNEL